MSNFVSKEFVYALCINLCMHDLQCFIGFVILSYTVLCLYFLSYFQLLFCFKCKFVMLWFTIFKSLCFMCNFLLKYKSISHFLGHFSAFNRFCWVQMLACLEECLEWCHLLLGSCDDVYVVTSMSCRRGRGKREGAGTGDWCEKMLWLVNIKKSLPCIVCVYSGDPDDFL